MNVVPSGVLIAQAASSAGMLLLLGLIMLALVRRCRPSRPIALVLMRATQVRVPNSPRFPAQTGYFSPAMSRAPPTIPQRLARAIPDLYRVPDVLQDPDLQRVLDLQRVPDLQSVPDLLRE